jgi:hypothetical protein
VVRDARRELRDVRDERQNDRIDTEHVGFSFRETHVSIRPRRAGRGRPLRAPRALVRDRRPST